MAVTKLLRMKERKKGNPSEHLKHNLCYICNPQKTGQGEFIGGNAGHSWESAYRNILRNKEYWEKEHGTQGFHYVISFPPWEQISPKQCLAFAEEFAEELLGEDYLYLIAVHDDTSHLHAHISFDSVSMTDGRKFHSPKGDWEKRIQPITDRLCRKFGFPILDPDGQTGKHYAEWKHEREQQKFGREMTDYTWYDIIRDDIDEAIEYSDSYHSFLFYLKEHGYRVRSGKYLSLKPDGRERAVRTGRLGKGYSKEEVQIRLADKEYADLLDYRMATYGNREQMKKIICAKIQKTPGWKMPPYQRQFYRRWNQTYFIRKPEYGKLSWAANRKEILEVTRLADVIRYLVEKDLESPEDLDRRKQELQKEKRRLADQKKVLSTQIQRRKEFGALRSFERYFKAMEETPEAYQRAAELLTEVEKYGTLDEVRKRYQGILDKRTELRRVERDLKQEEKLVKDAETYQKQCLRTEPKRNRTIEGG